MSTAIPYGYCQCGCGEQTNVTPQKIKKLGLTKGEPYRFVDGHYKKTGTDSPRWKGGRYLAFGYVFVYAPDHPRANNWHYVQEHIQVAEQALGKYLPVGVAVHHINEDRADNQKGNLVICQDTVYHHLLHARVRALSACGNPNYRRCGICKQWDDPAQLSSTNRHPQCHRTDALRRYHARKQRKKETA